MQEVRQETKKNKRRISKPVGIALFYIVCAATAAMVILHNNPLADKPTEDLKKICACALLLLACTIFGIYYDRIFIIPKELFQNRELIWKLAKNDFKKRYAGSYLGFLWALVQPVVTVVMYWIVFDVVFDTRSQMVASGVEVPYVLFLTAVLVPWFYFRKESRMEQMHCWNTVIWSKKWFLRSVFCPSLSWWRQPLFMHSL